MLSNVAVFAVCFHTRIHYKLHLSNAFSLTFISILVLNQCGGGVGCNLNLDVAESLGMQMNMFNQVERHILQYLGLFHYIFTFSISYDNNKPRYHSINVSKFMTGA